VTEVAAPPMELGVSRATVNRRSLALGAAVAVLIAINGYCFHALTEARRASHLVERAQSMLVQLRELTDAGRDLGDAARAYLQTGDARQLELNRGAMAKANQAAGEVRNLLQGDTEQRQRWDALEPSILRGLVVISRIVERRAAAGPAAPAIELPAVDSDVRERARLGIREMLRVEGDRLRHGSTQAERQAAMAQNLLLAGTGGSLALILAVFLLMQREVAARQAIDEVLKRTNAGLEQAIVERVHQLQAEAEERRRTGELLAALVQQSAMPIFGLDADRRVIFWNPAAERTFGYSAAEIVGQPYPLVPPEHLVEHEQIFQRFASGERRENLEVVRKHKDGRLITAIFSGAPLYDASGKFRAIAFMCEDVTQRKAIEEQLRQAQKMEAIGQLTGGVAHDFNNLLLVILGSLELALEDLGDRPELCHELDRAIRAGERGATLTRSLLAFARKQPLSPTRVQANRLVGEMVSLLSRTLGESIEIKLVTSDDLWFCEVDSGQLQNAVLNLAINARDAMAIGGKLTIETRNTELDADYAALNADVKTGEYVSIAISDTGTGMSADIVARVFEPFFTTKAGGKGNGLGLSMVYGFVKQSGGHIKIYSEVGVGTTIRMYMPRAHEGSASEPVTQEGIDVPRGTESILVVEDDADVRSLTIKILEGLGYHVLEASSATEAFACAAQGGEFSLLLTDVILSGGTNGRQLAETLLKSRPDLKVLYMSGYTENAIVHHQRLDAGVQLLQKPFRRKELATKLRYVLDQKTAAT
jgi:PAS domain S-box-containing protein